MKGKIILKGHRGDFIEDDVEYLDNRIDESEDTKALRTEFEVNEHIFNLETQRILFF